MGLVVKCEFVSETDPPVLTIPPEGQARPGAGLLLVECGACAAGWQVAHYARAVG